VASGRAYVSLTAGVGHTCAITTGGDAFCWGGNFDGELGTGNTSRSLTPRAVAGGLTFTAIDAGAGHTCGLTTGDIAYCWGGGTRGQLGAGPSWITHSLVPLKVAGQP
jgi:alpha-tubulin suppressor-like RCC1 family protein